MNNRVFVSFAIEDVKMRDLLVGQARNEKSPFSFTDMSVKEPWDKDWKEKCRTKIKGCDGMVGLISNSTPRATGQLFELECAYDEGIPVLLIYAYSDNHPSNLPEPIKNRRVYIWSWSGLKSFFNEL